MFTKNYIEFKKAVFLGGLSYGSFIDMNEASVSPADFGTADIGAMMRTARCRTPAANYGGVYFGTGATPAKRSDIKLEAVITTGLTITNSGNTLLAYENGVGTATSSYTVKNYTESEITIKEIGCYTTFGSSKTSPVLFERTVLDEPITIPPGVTKLVTYKLTFNHG